MTTMRCDWCEKEAQIYWRYHYASERTNFTCAWHSLDMFNLIDLTTVVNL